jgi:hypothetical protein
MLKRESAAPSLPPVYSKLLAQRARRDTLTGGIHRHTHWAGAHTPNLGAGRIAQAPVYPDAEYV